MLFCLSAQGAKPHTQSNRQGTEKSARSDNKAEAKEEIPPRVIFGQQLSALLSEQKWDEAIALFDTLPEEDRVSLSIRNLKVAVLISTGRIKDAEATAKALEKQYPSDLNVLYTMTMVAQAKNDKKMRRTYLKKIPITYRHYKKRASIYTIREAIKKQERYSTKFCKNIRMIFKRLFGVERFII